MNMKINKDIKRYIRELTGLVWDDIRYRASFPANTVLAVQRELAYNIFEIPENCRGCDFYAPNLLVTRNAKGADVPNRKMIRTIANRYY